MHYIGVAGLAVCLLTALSQPAFAQGKFRLLVAGVQVPSEQLSQAEGYVAQLHQHMAGQGVDVVPQSQWLRWQDKFREQNRKQSVTQDLDKARSLLVKGKEHYHYMRYDEAMVTLTEVQRILILGLPQLRSNRDLIDVHLYLGMTAAAMKDTAKAESEFKKLSYLDPDMVLTGRDYSPDTLSAFAKARQAVLSGTPGRLRIDSQPSGSSVYLNGRLLSEKTPMTLRLQPGGDYFVLVDQPGFAPWYQLVSLQSSLMSVQANHQAERVDGQWHALFRTREGPDQQSGDLSFVQEMAQAVGANLVLFSTLQQSGQYRLLGQLWNPQQSTFTGVTLASLGQDMQTFAVAAKETATTLMNIVRNEQAQALAQAGLSPYQVGDADGRPPAGDQVIGKKWYQHWWIYPALVAVGAGVFLGAKELGGTGGSKVTFVR